MTSTLLGGSPATASTRQGTTEEVFLRQLPVRLYPKLRDLASDESAQLELYCDRPSGWADTLTPESHEALLAAAEDLNSDFFQRWVERQRTKQERVIGETASVLAALQKSNPGLVDDLLKKAVATSPVTSPKSPSPAG